mgnify:CR=1 FL=1
MNLIGVPASGLNSIVRVARSSLVPDETFVITPSVTDSFLSERIGSLAKVSALGPLSHLKGMVGVSVV